MSDPVLGLCLAALADGPLDQALAAAAELSLTVVDLPTDTISALGRSLPQPDDVAGMVADAGLRVHCVSNSRDAQLLLGPNGPHTDAACPGTARAKAEHARRMALEAIELACVLGAPLVRLLLGCPDFGRWFRWSGSEVGWDDNVEAYVEAAVPLAEVAERHGVRLCIEPHVKQVAFDVPSLVACVAGLRRAGTDPAVCFDPANVAALGFDPVDFLHATGLAPACVHAKDLQRSTGPVPPTGHGWVRYGPQPAIRFRSVPWGILDWPAILTGLHEVGFEGPLLIEHEDVVVGRRPGIAQARDHLLSLALGEESEEPWW